MIGSLFDEITAWATFGPEVNKDGEALYRYTLGRSWAVGPRLLWVMLNPSTATAEVLDPTIRRCLGFSRAWGYGSLEVVNVYAYRATDPKALDGVFDPVGPDNDRAITLAVGAAAAVVAAWGAHAGAAKRVADVYRILAPLRPCCLGTTKAGAPRHPLYACADTHVLPWSPP